MDNSTCQEIHFQNSISGFNEGWQQQIRKDKATIPITLGADTMFCSFIVSYSPNFWFLTE